MEQEVSEEVCGQSPSDGMNDGIRLTFLRRRNGHINDAYRRLRHMVKMCRTIPFVSWLVSN
jgi:hypothetical protein